MRYLLMTLLFSAVALADDASNWLYWQRAQDIFATASPLTVAELPRHFNRSNATCVGHVNSEPLGLSTGVVFSFDRGEDPTLGLSFVDFHWGGASKRLGDNGGELSNDGVTLRKSVNGANVSWIVHVLTFSPDYYYPQTGEAYCWVAQ